MLNPRVIGVVIGLMGVVLLISGVYITLQEMAFLDRCLTTKAVVIDLYWEEEWVETEEGGYFAWVGWPVFQFKDMRTGVQVTARGSVGGPDPPSVGQEVDILYDPENLSGPVTVNSFWDIWLLSIVFFFIAAIFTSVGLVVIVHTQHKMP